MEWQPIETAPKDGTEILIYNKSKGYLTESGDIAVVSFIKGHGLGCGWISASCCDGVTRFVPSHWMPLPEPPKE